MPPHCLMKNCGSIPFLDYFCITASLVMGLQSANILILGLLTHIHNVLDLEESQYALMINC